MTQSQQPGAGAAQPVPNQPPTPGLPTPNFPPGAALPPAGLPNPGLPSAGLPNPSLPLMPPIPAPNLGNLPGAALPNPALPNGPVPGIMPPSPALTNPALPSAALPTPATPAPAAPTPAAPTSAVPTSAASASAATTPPAMPGSTLPVAAGGGARGPVPPLPASLPPNLPRPAAPATPAGKVPAPLPSQMPAGLPVPPVPVKSGGPVPGSVPTPAKPGARRLPPPPAGAKGGPAIPLPRRNPKRAPGERTPLLNLSNLTMPGGPNAALSFRELLSQPVSNAVSVGIGITSTKDNGDVVGMAMPSAPPPDERYPIPYIQRRHAGYYTNYEIRVIMESIIDPIHARHVLARIIAFPHWLQITFGIVAFLCGSSVSILNGFLSLMVFVCATAANVAATYMYAERIISGRFFDPVGYKVSWLCGFAAISTLSAIMVARAFVPQPALALIGGVGLGLYTYLWNRWLQLFQVRRLINSTIESEDTERAEASAIAEAVAAVSAQVDQRYEHAAEGVRAGGGSLNRPYVTGSGQLPVAGGGLPGGGQFYRG